VFLALAFNVVNGRIVEIEAIADQDRLGALEVSGPNDSGQRRRARPARPRGERL
jgi:hypothetical protein